MRHGRAMARRRRRGAFWVPFLLLCGAALPAAAQEPDLGSQEALRQQERERVLREREEARPDVRLGRQDEALVRLPATESPCFPVDRIVLDGDGAGQFDWALRAVDPPEDPATGRCLGTEGVGIVMRRVQNAIIARGYVTTRVLAAPQDLKTGALVLTVVPGRVGSLRPGDDAGPRAGVRNAVPAGAGDLLNLRDIEQALENLQRVPGTRADVRIVPGEDAGAGPGTSDLRIDWAPRRRLRTHLSLDDAGSEATGKLQASATLSLDNGLLLNDLFYVSHGRGVLNGSGKDTSNWTAHYDVPYGYWLVGATVGGYEYAQTVPGAFQAYEYRGTSRNSEVRISRLLRRDADSKTGAYVRGWRRTSHNYIDDVEVEVQRRRMAGWELGVTHRHFLGRAILDASLAYRRGTGAMDALAAPEEPFGEGTARGRVVLADAQLGIPFQVRGRQLRYTAALRTQWNQTPLVPQERFSIGGRYTVRGFDGEAALTGDRGWLLRNDLGLALRGGMELYLAVDGGGVGGRSAHGLPGRHLAGTAVGLRGGWRGMYWDGFVGTPLHKPSGLRASTTLGFSLGWSH